MIYRQSHDGLTRGFLHRIRQGVIIQPLVVVLHAFIQNGLHGLLLVKLNSYCNNRYYLTFRTNRTSAMNAHYFQHVPFEGLGSIEYWLKQQQASIGVTRFYAGDGLPNSAKVDLLIVMGGPMSVNDEHEYPWLKLEKQFIRDFIASGKPVLGICLGAQLIANAMGSAVYAGQQKEIGWWPIESAANLPASAFVFPDSATVFHWHGETFDLPAGAVRLASSAICENQAFQLGGNAIGLQFHLETTLASAHNIVDHCSDELVNAPYIQPSQQILGVDPNQYRSINEQMNRLLDFLVNHSKTTRQTTRKGLCKKANPANCSTD